MSKYWLQVAAAILVLLAFGPVFEYWLIFEIGSRLIFGWVTHVRELAGQVRLSGEIWLMIGLFAIGTLVVGHCIAAWLWREMRGNSATSSTWQTRWSVSATMAVMLLFGIGIAATGIAHQAGWMLRSPDQSVTYLPYHSVRIHCASNMRQLGQAMLLYYNENNLRYPDDLGVLVTTQDIGGGCFVCPKSDLKKPQGKTPAEVARQINAGHTSYVYFGRGFRADELPADYPLAIEASTNHGDGMNVLFADGHVEFIRLQYIPAILEKLDRPPATQPVDNNR